MMIRLTTLKRDWGTILRHLRLTDRSATITFLARFADVRCMRRLDSNSIGDDESHITGISAGWGLRS